MINNEQLPDLYKQKATTFTDEQLNSAQLPAATKTWLKKNGLPATSEEIALGIHLPGSIEEFQFNGKSYWQIGYEWEHVSIIALEEGSGAVFSITVSKGTPQVFINTDLPAFLTFLQYYKQYQGRKSAVEIPIATYSRDEMLKRLQEMKNRTITPPPPRKEKFDQKREFKAMKQFFKQNDAAAIQDENNWWSIILEQVEDDLL
ncbi:SUKH-4 family immunity protein [Chitinophaga sp. S165]|uniref:SUKH-4 family immunity protein n=1 Tax=Chitinophaga sp. S165 TaxID=2135462 RepID=UPI000D712967|nr:SUKH-4 family immunity protein [Chitinophaga sp. S165]PWV48339.1 SUKH-4 immunity protein of toxin-antitoxin system [Chitinophaga sp. S165]